MSHTETAPVQQFRPMSIADYDASLALWTNTAGVRLRDADSRENVEKYLSRNPDLSFVAEADGKIVGTIMAGHDGKRGYIQHLSVAAPYRRQGIASRLVSLCLDALKSEGILKSHLMVLIDNQTAQQFWTALGWQRRRDIDLYSFINGAGENA
ncbi:MAG: GNAT family N-acetyltransferase [Pseudomonadales bacterium]|jgi:ribosomal protein S18 acetylase RimI-like enzyme|nr:GNAT family N-acetyltransferase [Pseudomonadales bacterium]